MKPILKGLPFLTATAALLGFLVFKALTDTQHRAMFILGAVLVFPALAWIGLVARMVHERRSGTQQIDKGNNAA